MDGENIVTGEFRYDTDTGKLEFTCHEKNRTFAQVQAALAAMRDELQRQLNDQLKCPYYEKLERIDLQCRNRKSK